MNTTVVNRKIVFLKGECSVQHDDMTCKSKRRYQSP